jgi:hypothetical protein
LWFKFGRRWVTTAGFFCNSQPGFIVPVRRFQSSLLLFWPVILNLLRKRVMKSINALLILLVAFMLGSCELVGDIFGAGVYTGMFIVIFVVVLIIVVVARLFRRR